ncbi:hypothetical protein [Limosilactobacillus reuteri]|uniref:hypothetical protein n=1 Tax=Limosilactobacillus reuteri TaxID=1598 RepID=UPI001C5BCB0B|nr:hypothetical protein [Limosilactobacillus reuteri]MBW3351336.1 hypothetical protein [Limosilactobacillus reuteri]UUW69728.1 hypothetical protein NUJ10_11865 [Limosilactobacillus reuteri]
MNAKEILEKREISTKKQLNIVGGTIIGSNQLLESKMSGFTSKTKGNLFTWAWNHTFGNR